jgi:5-formyltetrahydrofolate cyclo-ligase
VNDKIQLRAKLRERYKQLSREEITEIDKKLIAQLDEHPVFKEAKRIFIYASVANEINTLDLIECLYKNGRVVALPKCEPMGEMKFFKYNGRLSEGCYRIPEPVSDVILEPGSEDVLIVPGLAFDTMGYRMGQGGGYYDRYLSKHHCVTIGVCREQFILNHIPKEWNDLPVDYVITEATVYECKKNGAS